jgi:hypothetical protein
MWRGRHNAKKKKKKYIFILFGDASFATAKTKWHIAHQPVKFVVRSNTNINGERGVKKSLCCCIAVLTVTVLILILTQFFDGDTSQSTSHHGEHKIEPWLLFGKRRPDLE